MKPTNLFHLQNLFIKYMLLVNYYIFNKFKTREPNQTKMNYLFFCNASFDWVKYYRKL